MADETRDELLRLADVAKVDVLRRPGGADLRRLRQHPDGRVRGSRRCSSGRFWTAPTSSFTGGDTRTGMERIALEPTGNFESVADLRRTVVSLPGRPETVFLEALAEVSRGYVDPPASRVFASGAPPWRWASPCATAATSSRSATRSRASGRSGEKIVLRTIGQAYRGAEFEDLVPWTWADGSRPRLGDVATVVDGFEETDQYARFDVEPTMLVSVFRTGDQSAIEIATLASEYVAEAEARLPEGRLADRLAERRRVAEHPASLMLRSGFAGFALVLLVLALFLELRLAFWVSLGPRSRSWAPSPCTSGLGRLRQRALAVRLRPRARNRRRRRDHRRREHLPAPGGARRRPARLDRGGRRDREAGHVRGADDGGRVQPAAVRARHAGARCSGSYRWSSSRACCSRCSSR